MSKFVRRKIESILKMNEEQLPPQIPIYEKILNPLKHGSNKEYRNLISAIISSLKREDHMFFSVPMNLDQNEVAQFLEYILRNLFPLTISFYDTSRKWHFQKSAHSHQNPEAREHSSPYLSNVLIITDFDQFFESNLILKIIHELSINIGEESVQLSMPFVVFGIVRESSFLPHEFLQTFSIHASIKSLPHNIPAVSSSLYQSYEGFIHSTKSQIFLCRDLQAYMGQIVLRIDCAALITSYIEGKTKLLIQKAAEDHAILDNRNFIIPDDIKAVIPFFLSSKIVLPGKFTSFRTALEFVIEQMTKVSVPV